MAELFTTFGSIRADKLGFILPHEHVFVDFRTPDYPGYALTDTPGVLTLMVPEINKARAEGVTALIDCTPIGVGRRADIVKAVSLAAGFPLVIPTGVYREPNIPAWVHAASEPELTEWMHGELDSEIEETGFKAGWIKLSAGDDGMTECETKVLRAAARAAAATNAVIGSHTIRGRVVHQQLDVIEAAGHSAERFIWIHTHMEPNFELHLEVASRGAWLEYDGIGQDDQTDEYFIEHIQRVLDSGFTHQLLLSQDRGWFDPALPNGGTPKPYTYLSEYFLPQLKGAGVDAATIRQLTHANPFRAFAR